MAEQRFYAVDPRTGQRTHVWDGRNWVRTAPQAPPEAETKASLDAIKDARDRRDASRAVVDGLQTFNQLNQRRSTGPILGDLHVPFVGPVNVGRAVVNAVNPQAAADYQTMDSIAERLAPQMRAAGSGASSDRDIAGFKRSIPSVDKFGAANAGISQEYQRLLELNQRRLDDLTNQYNANRRTVMNPQAPGVAPGEYVYVPGKGLVRSK